MPRWLRDTARRGWRLHHALVAMALIAAATLCAYWPSFRSPFQFDDFNDIATPYFHLTSPRALIQRYPTRWIPYLTLLANARLPRLQWRHWRPAELVWHHIVNWLAHVGVTWLVYLLTVRLQLIMRPRGVLGRGGAARHAALVAALLFGLHPMLAQTVIYLSQRATLFMAVCYLGLLYSIAGTRRAHAKGVWHWLGAGIWLLVGFFCKETIVSAPVAAMLLLYLTRRPLQQGWHWRSLLWWGLGMALACGAALLLFLHLSHWDMSTMRHNVRSIGGPLHTHTPGLTRRTYAITQITVVGRYLRLAVWPRGLSIDHDVPLMTSLWQGPVVMWGGALLALGVLAWRWRARLPLFSWGYGFFVIALLPQSSLMPTPDLMLEYRAYPALAGVVWMGVALYGALISAPHCRCWRRIAPALVAGTLTVFAVLTWQRSVIWRSDVTLWYDAWRRAPHKQRPANNLANALLRLNETDAALMVLQQTLAANTSTLPHVIMTLGNIYASRGQFDAATNAYVIALYHDWFNRDLRYNLALTYARMNQRALALNELLWLGHVFPEYADAWLLLGSLCSETPPLLDLATNAFTRYLQLVPHGPAADTARAALDQLVNQY